MKLLRKSITELSRALVGTIAIVDEETGELVRGIINRPDGESRVTSWGRAMGALRPEEKFVDSATIEHTTPPVAVTAPTSPLALAGKRYRGHPRGENEPPSANWFSRGSHLVRARRAGWGALHRWNRNGRDEQRGARGACLLHHATPAIEQDRGSLVARRTLAILGVSTYCGEASRGVMLEKRSASQ
jgi:hypothetical protein